MSTCDFDLLSQYLDGDLTLPQRVRLEEHMASCTRCDQELRELRGLDTVLSTWGGMGVPIPVATEGRIARSVDARQRPNRIAAISRVMPAAVGTSIAALLVLVSVNLGALAPLGGGSSAASVQPEVSRVIVKQSAPLVSVRRTSAVLGGYATPAERQSPIPHRLQLDFN